MNIIIEFIIGILEYKQNQEVVNFEKFSYTRGASISLCTCSLFCIIGKESQKVLFLLTFLHTQWPLQRNNNYHAHIAVWSYTKRRGFQLDQARNGKKGWDGYKLYISRFLVSFCHVFFSGSKAKEEQNCFILNICFSYTM